MQRVGKFSLGGGGGGGGAIEDYLEVCFVGLVVTGNYVWCLVIFVIFMGFGGAEVGGCYVVIIWGWQCKLQEGGCNFNGEGGVGFSLYVILLC